MASSVSLPPESFPPGTSVQNGPGGLPQLRVVTPLCEGALYLHGAQVTGWTPAGSKPALWLSEAAQFEAGKAIRGGIPLCGPWFGPGIDGRCTPAHGWLRLHEWTLESVRLDGDDLVAVLTLDGREVDGGPLLARYEVRFGSELRCRLTLEALEPQTVELALHTYVAVSDIERVAVAGLEGIAFTERAGGDPVPGVETEPVRFLRGVDRIYRTSEPCGVVDLELDRVIVVSKEDSAATVVWNPGAEQAAALSDVSAEGWRRFVCVEAANVKDDAITLAAGERASCAMTLTVAEQDE